MGRRTVYIFALLAASLVFAQTNDADPSRSVRLDLTPVEGASQYELQVQPFQGNESNTNYYYSECCIVVVQMAPGRYRLRSKVFPDGPWGKWESIAVHFKFPDKVYPASGQKITPMFSDNEDVYFQWPSLKEAKFYHFEIQDAGGKTLFSKELNQSSLHVSLAVGQKYSWTILPLTYAGEEKDVKLRFTPFEILKPTAAGATVKIQLHQDARAVTYEAEVIRLSQMSAQPALLTSQTSLLILNMNSGSYQVRARSVDKNGERSKWSAPTHFNVP